MPQDWFASIVEPKVADPEFKRVVREINDRLRRIADAVARSTGFGGQEVALGGELHAKGNRVKGVGKPQADDDAVNVAFLREQAITGKPGQAYIADRMFEARRGIRTHERALDPFDLVPLGQVEDLIDDSIGNAVSGGVVAPSAGAFLLAVTSPGLPNARVLVGTADQINVIDNGAGSTERIALLPTGVAAGVYGNSTFVPQITVDVYGRLLDVTMVPIAFSGAGGLTSEEPTGLRPGTGFVTINAFVSHALYVNGIRWKFVPGTPLVGEYDYSGTTLTTGATIDAGDWLFMEGTTVPTSTVNEEPTGSLPGTVFTTANTFVTQGVWVNGLRWKHVGSSPALGQYTYVAPTLTLGASIDVGDWLYMEGTV